MRKTKMAFAFCLITALLFSPLAAMDDHGANVVVTKKDGTLTQGELMAVKRNALVVSSGGTSAGESVSVAIEDIGKVEVIKKSNVLKGMLTGALVGGGIGAVGGLISGNDRPTLVSFTALDKAGIFGLVGGGIGLFIGYIVGEATGTDKTFRFDLSKEERDSALLHLSEYAVIKGVR